MSYSIRKYGHSLCIVVETGESKLLRKLDAYAVINPTQMRPNMTYVFPFLSGKEVKDVIGYIPDDLTMKEVKNLSYYASFKNLSLDEIVHGKPFVTPDGFVTNKLLYDLCIRIGLRIQSMEITFDRPSATDAIMLYDMLLGVVERTKSDDPDIRTYVATCESPSIEDNFKMPLAKWAAILESLESDLEIISSTSSFDDVERETFEREKSFFLEGVQKVLKPTIGV